MGIDLPASALARLAAMLDGCKATWVVGGSTGLVLRGAKLDRAPRDLDIYVDNASVSIVHERLSSYALDEPVDNQTERYQSILSHYNIIGTQVELVGDFRVSAYQSLYTTEVSPFLFPNSDKISVEGYEVPLVPLGHELIFNLLRDRKDRAEVVGHLIRQAPERHLPILHALLKRNSISSDIAAEALNLANNVAQYPSPSSSNKEPV
ncbi:nucleotidyltransferase domain-containing protein [Cohnella sp. WQ 127256]|uniref:nucleotidyltransferase domain-containing protein n=1 Tax=Cohnella sp. WQ 127256 TaxID=2938790 RepID=UPI002117ADB6|nr:hypothetical protein [Cohnella sp. WQ 127256]